MGDKLAEARTRLWNTHRLWTHLERNPNTRQDQLRQILDGDQDEWRSTVQAWARMGLVRRTPEGGSYRVALSTRMGQVVPAKCPFCGRVAEAPKAMFLETTKCPKCRKPVAYVLLATANDTDTRE
jgi:hypothetical protein